jgi:hypothetical protein
MRKWFQRSLWVGSAYFIGLFVAIMSSILYQDSAVVQFATSFAVAIICTAPILLLFMIITGIGTLRERRDQSEEKRKRDWSADFYSDDEQRLRQILDRLSADDRAFVESKLAGRSYRLNEDGEIVSLGELLDDQQRSRYR